MLNVLNITKVFRCLSTTELKAAYIPHCFCPCLATRQNQGHGAASLVYF